jgi:hypothetical protein
MNGAMPNSRSLTGCAAKNVSRADQSVPHTATGDTPASSSGRKGAAPTPFYDQLMSMVHATALENKRAAQHDEGDAASHVSHPRWRIHPLIPCCIAGLIIIAATGRVLLVPEVSQKQPPVVTSDADNAPEDRSRVADKAALPEEPAEKALPAAEPDGLEPIGVEGKRTAEGEVGAEPVQAAKSDERPLAAAGQPATNPTDEQPPPADAPSPLPSAIETGSVARPDAAATVRIARVVSGVNMRAGPSNDQPVLATISRGSPVEVIHCRQWCEVVFAGQRGWVYKSFVEGR